MKKPRARRGSKSDRFVSGVHGESRRHADGCQECECESSPKEDVFGVLQRFAQEYARQHRQHDGAHGKNDERLLRGYATFRPPPKHSQTGQGCATGESSPNGVDLCQSDRNENGQRGVDSDASKHSLLLQFSRCPLAYRAHREHQPQHVCRALTPRRCLLAAAHPRSCATRTEPPTTGRHGLAAGHYTC